MNKGLFCFSFLSVFCITLSILIIVSVIESSPLIFLRLAELEVGQFDGVLSPAYEGPLYNLENYNVDNDDDDKTFLNFT